jgi:RNA 2',3'-cyclic 3'-phosphodiesterase
MRCLIRLPLVGTDVGFHFHNAPHAVAMNDGLAQQRTRHLDRGLGVEAARQNCFHGRLNRIMRLFVGLAIPGDIMARVTATVEQLRPAAPKLRWSPAGNLHITTKFVGQWSEERLAEMTAGLRSIQAAAFDVHLAGMGWFPNPHSPRIFWLAARGGEALNALAAKTDEVTAAIGVAKEDRPYTPHLTLARVNAGVDLRELRGAVAELTQPDWGRFRAEEFYLYRSDPGPAGSVYTKLARFPLSAEG